MWLNLSQVGCLNASQATDFSGFPPPPPFQEFVQLSLCPNIFLKEEKYIYMYTL